MNASEMTNVQIADYILSLQSDVDGFPFSSNEIIREAAKRLLTDGDDDISKDAEIKELRECLGLAIQMKCANCGLCTRGVEPCYPDGAVIGPADCWMIMKWREALEGVNDEGR